jgi:rare lipoprotein A
MWKKWITCSLAGMLMFPLASWSSETEGSDKKPAATEKKKTSSKKKLDRSGKAKRGEASYYGGKRFAWKTMADGTPMNPNANIAASKTLPLGTKAEVVNLDNGKSAVVEIRDRGPYIDGRIIDVSPKVAEDLDMKEEGVAPVVVKPIELPPPKGMGEVTSSGSSE